MSHSPPVLWVQGCFKDIKHARSHPQGRIIENDRSRVAPSLGCQTSEKPEAACPAAEMSTPGDATLWTHRTAHVWLGCETSLHTMLALQNLRVNSSPKISRQHRF